MKLSGVPSKAMSETASQYVYHASRSRRISSSSRLGTNSAKGKFVAIWLAQRENMNPQVIHHGFKDPQQQLQHHHPAPQPLRRFGGTQRLLHEILKQATLAKQ
ncbi:uncharacterized protein TRIREDRAFT_109476 [Trichoderma reesei QM6a]|uniref:Predicted protein n=2 Tax=Hypocrea jecorina TaxID=51453 RepID=G0RPZ6_HYPJQ|nr:uncharacterized protein TRIREDRAFT_109476 [Trichoderma reesei QM6a]EGR46835.1 predicted protein [Trichoderma reesei QM6a]ETS00358.1 hypothetical protein M419DRAFT_131496 [Trichoderma reesei RUT C-30]